MIYVLFWYVYVYGNLYRLINAYFETIVVQNIFQVSLVLKLDTYVNKLFFEKLKPFQLNLWLNSLIL